MNTNSWGTFKIEGAGLDRHFGKLIVCKDLLLIIGDSYGKICLAAYNLGNLVLGARISPKGQDFNSLFMDDQGSDVKFKVQERIIPAHKKVLIEKSRFFAGLFKSGMAETKQDVIEIKDCDFATFQEFLRFIYCDEIDIDDKRLAFKLLDFADKHIQDDLFEICLGDIQSNINSKTVFTIFEEAHERKLENIVNWCVNYIKNNLKLTNLSGLVQCRYPKSCLELRDIVLDWVMKNYFEIHQKQNESLRLCEEFLIKNIEKETIEKISEFIVEPSKRNSFIDGYKASVLYRPRIPGGKLPLLHKYSEEEHDEAERKAREVFKQEILKLREAINLIPESWKEMMKKREIPEEENVKDMKKEEAN